jgi:hypothetical protein
LRVSPGLSSANGPKEKKTRESFGVVGDWLGLMHWGWNCSHDIQAYRRESFDGLSPWIYHWKVYVRSVSGFEVPSTVTPSGVAPRSIALCIKAVRSDGMYAA